MNVKQLVSDSVSKVKTYWKTPMAGRYMTFKEIAAYSGGGIGAYMIITLGTACLLATNNTLLSSTLGIDPTDMYIMYVIAVIANIPLTGIRANIIDNTRNKAGKYRPYIFSMALPAALICLAMVWFPYNSLKDIFGTAVVFDGKTADYIAKCAIIMVLNLLLHFFYYFFYDAYENLIHVLSPNSQERADVASVKSVVYSLAPTLVNLFTPIIAQNVFNTNSTDIRVYRLLYPILTVLGLLLCIVVYKNTEEKIVQAKTHVVQIRFMDALRAVAKNKYFWIISLAGWIGFLETAYANIMYWLYNYGGACNGNEFGLIQTIYGNASLWGMLAAPFCIRKWGKKSVLIVTNLFNVAFILLMLPFVSDIKNATIWLVLGCLYLNALMGSFAHILNPSIQADIRDYQQYKTGERIDGMFGAVGTIGAVITLLTSAVLPFIYKKGGLTSETAKVVTSRPEILSRVLDTETGKTVGDILAEQLANGQDNYSNAYSALYDPDILLSLIKVLIIVAAVGAFMNVIPYIWYDFSETKQKSIVRVLKIRAMFEDFGNGMLKDGELVEAVDIVRKSRMMATATPKTVSKKDYKAITDKAARKEAKKAYKEALEYNEEIEIAKFVCEELDKFATKEFQYSIEESQRIYDAGLSGIFNMDISEARGELAAAKAMSKATKDEKAVRKAAIEIARNKVIACSTIKKSYSDISEFVQPSFKELEACYEREDFLENRIKQLNNSMKIAREKNNAKKIKEISEKLTQAKADIALARENTKALSDKIATFNRAAKPYINAEKLLKQKENYGLIGEIEEKYERAKINNEKALAKAEAEAKRKKAEEEALTAKLKAEKEAKKAAKKAAKKK